jgi:hypothetical protein
MNAFASGAFLWSEAFLRGEESIPRNDRHSVANSEELSDSYFYLCEWRDVEESKVEKAEHIYKFLLRSRCPTVIFAMDLFDHGAL